MLKVLETTSLPVSFRCVITATVASSSKRLFESSGEVTYYVLWA